MFTRFSAASIFPASLSMGRELKRFGRAKLARVAIIAIVLLPLLYSALYLWAFWNPFGQINKLPVAFVNEDKGAYISGKPLNAGDQIVENLKTNDQVHFDYVSKEEALEGVKNGRYYFMVELTPDFSEAVASPAGGAPRKAVIQATYNDTNGYLSTMIGENVMRTMMPVISQSIGEQTIDRVLVGVQAAGHGLDQAADGAAQLTKGLSEANQGAEKLQAGATQVDEKLGELAAGAEKLHQGTQTLDQAVTQATGQLDQMVTGVGDLHQGLVQLGDGATQINDGVQQLKARVDGITAAQGNAAEQIKQLTAQLQPLQANPAVQGAIEQLNQLAAALETQGAGPNSHFAQDIQKLANGTSQLAYQLGNEQAPFRAGMDQLAQGTGTLPGKIGELVDGVHQLNAGAGQLADGAARLRSEGTTPLTQGATNLATGVNKLEEGSNTLATKLRTGASAVPAWSEEQREATASVLGGPVALQTTNEAGNNTFGGGLAPFFFSLALFIGGLIIFLLLKPMNNRALAAGLSPLRAALNGLVPAGVIATLQAIMVVAVTIFAVGLRPAHPWLLTLFCIGVALMFTAVNQMLNVALGPGPGKVACMALLMFQILASGGLYPVETEPRLFQWLYHVNPMSYSINGIRELIYGSIDARLGHSITAVIVITCVALGLTALCAYRDRLWSMKRLHPAIQI